MTGGAEQIRNRRSLLELGLWVVIALLPLVLGFWQIAQLAQFFTYGILALSLAFVWGQGGLLCFGQAVFFGIGAYAMSVVTLGMLPGQNVPGSSFVGLAAAVLLPALFANLLGRFLFYGRGLSGAYLGIVTLAIAVIAERLAVHWDYLGGLNGLMNVPPFTFQLSGGAYEVWQPLQVYYLTLAFAFLTYLLLQGVIASRYGTVVRAIRDGTDRVTFFGYDTSAYRVTVFTLGAAVAGLAGGLFVTLFNFASPALIGFTLSTEVLIWVALGGRASLMAAFLGAVLVRFLEDLLSETLDAYWLLALGLLFVLSVVTFPRGVIGEALYRLGGRPPRGE